ncbi:hypothetical protein Ct61P_11297 [Colletotrichum tofieldiae]|nr:hypothetical protein Ct61P_11297 [Colletotrichum tofieldiae]
MTRARSDLTILRQGRKHNKLSKRESKPVRPMKFSKCNNKLSKFGKLSKANSDTRTSTPLLSRI